MSNICLPSSVGKLCQVLSSIRIGGRFVSHHAAVSKARSVSSGSLPAGVLSTISQNAQLNHPPASSAILPTGLRVERQNPSSNLSVNEATNDGLFFRGIEHEYICPSNTHTKLPLMIILDQSISQNRIIDCPSLPQTFYDITLPELKIHEISDPAPHSRDGSEKTPPAKEARRIMKIRRQKMNRHLLKKFRKRMTFTHRKQKMKMRRKKEVIFLSRLNAIKKSGDDFDALEFVQRELEIARKGGFQIDVFESKRQ